MLNSYKEVFNMTWSFDIVMGALAVLFLVGQLVLLLYLALQETGYETMKRMRPTKEKRGYQKAA
jgi:uncharacterized membrane protein